MIAGKCPVHRALAGETPVAIADRIESRSGALMDLGLAGRACVVTGASRGIGRATARMLVRRGRLGAARRAATPARSATAAAECAAAARRRRRSRATLALDVTDADAGERIVDAAEARFGKLDVAGQQRRHRASGATSTRSRRPTGTRPGSST